MNIIDLPETQYTENEKPHQDTVRYTFARGVHFNTVAVEDIP